MRKGLRFAGMTITLLAVLLVCFGALAANSGSCGTGVTWALDESGVLTISGTGDMNDFEYTELAPEHIHCTSPWYANAINIRTVIIAEGVTRIGQNAFHDCRNLTRVFIPASVVCISFDSFAGIDDLTDVCYFGSEQQWHQIQIFENNDRQILERALQFAIPVEVPDLFLPASLERIEDDAFADVRYVGIEIPGMVTFIAENAFDRSVTIFCEAGGYVETRCRNLGLTVKTK